MFFSSAIGTVIIKIINTIIRSVLCSVSITFPNYLVICVYC